MSFTFDPFLSQAQKALDHLGAEFASIRTGRASVQLLDTVRVEAYGTMMKIQEVANVSVPDPTLLVVQPWDKSILQNIEKAIASAGLNLSPVVDGALIRVPVPALTEERRKELVKVVHQRAELLGNQVLRKLRVECKQDIERQKDEAGVSEDDIKLQLEQLEKHMKTLTDQVASLASRKEAELMQVGQ